MKKIIIQLGVLFGILLSVFQMGKKQGKEQKENEILKNNEKKKKEYEKNNPFSSINDVIKFLRKK